MPPFDIVVGLDNATLNSYLAQVYNTLNTNDPSLFTYQTSSTTDSGLGPMTTTIIFQVQGPPTATLVPSAAAQAHVEQLLANPPDELAAVRGLAPETLAAMAAAAAGASFDVSVPIGVMFLAGSLDSGTLSLTLQVQTGTNASGQNYLTLQALTGSVTIPGGDQALVDFADAVLPLLLAYVNGTILSPFQIPALQYSSLTVSMPVPVVQDGFLLAFSALGSAQPDVPAASTWPAGTVFVGADPAVLVAAANIVLPKGTSTGFSWGPISGSAGASVQQLSAGAVTVNGDGSLTVQASFNAGAQLTLETPWPLPNFSFGPTATATVTATATAAVVNGELQLTADDIDPPSFNVSFGDIPGWVEWVLSPLLDALGDALGGVLAGLATGLFSDLAIPVYQIPGFSVSLGGMSYDIALTQASTSGCPNPQGVLLVVEAQGSFTGPPIQFAPTIGMQTANGDYVVVVNNGGLGGGTVAIQTGQTVVGPWEQFTVETVNAQAGTFRLKTSAGYYVTAVNGGGMGGSNDYTCPIHTDAPAISDWEQLTMQPQPNGTYAICTSAGYYLTAVNGGGYIDPLNAQPIATNRTVPGAWETFTAVPYSQAPSPSNQPPNSNQGPSPWPPLEPPNNQQPPYGEGPFQPWPPNQPPTSQPPTNQPPYGGLCPMCVSGVPPADDATEAIAEPTPETD